MTLPPSAPQLTDPAAAPVVPGAPAVKQTERPHPLTPFIRGWILFVAIVIGWGQQLLPDGRGDRFNAGDLLSALPFVGALVLLAAGGGFVSWYFTRFVIDDDELRLETGAVFKSSKRVAFERLQSVDVIQPLAARMFGLAELRIEVGAGDSTLRLRYLTRAHAARLREYLLARAHGSGHRVDDADLAQPASAFTDLGAADTPLVKVSVPRLVVSFLFSTEWLVTAGLLVVGLVVTGIYDVMAYALPGLLPLLIGAVSVIGRRVFAMYGFTLSESARGLRVTRGLTNLSSQSVPVNRIQGVKTSQPLLWRPFGWYRVDVDIVGYAGGDSENNDSAASSVLLPVADAAEVALAVGLVLPGFALESIELHAVPRRARVVRWFDWWTLRYGWNDRALVTEAGWLTHVRDVLPHAKTQSVRIEQGPLQRRLRLADVHVDTPRGPVNVVAHQLDAAVARELVLSQLDRARAARRADRLLAEQAQADRGSRRADGVGGPAGADGLLATFGIDRSQLLGQGGECEVFALPDPERVLRLYRSEPELSHLVAGQLRGLYGSWAGTDIGVEVPLTYELGRRGGRTYAVDRRFSGRSFSGWLATAERDERRRALLSYLDAVTALPRLPSPVPGFARLAGAGALQPYGSLAELLNAMLADSVQQSRTDLERDLPEVARVWQRLQADLAERSVTPVVVHGDVCPPNTYLSLGPSGPVVTGIGDFSPHSMHADPVIDLTGAVAFLELEHYPEAAEDAAWLTAVVLDRYGATPAAAGDLGRWLGVYRRYFGFYFSNSAAAEPELYRWCLQQLRS